VVFLIDLLFSIIDVAFSINKDMHNEVNDKDINTKERVDLLIVRFYSILPPEKQDDVEEWLHKDENCEIFQTLQNEEGSLSKAMDLIDSSRINDRLKELKKKVKFVRSASTPHKGYWLMGHFRIAAACILLLLTFSAILIYTYQGTTKTAVADIKPGGLKATLAFEGDVIDLQTAKDGIIWTGKGLTIVKKNGVLQYIADPGETDATDFPLNTISTPQGGTYQVILSDGTKVWLNAASSMQFLPVYVSNERRVSINGEVYFEVTHVNSVNGVRKPFIVDIKDRNIKIEVVGTKFNVYAYADEPIVKTTLLEGAIRIITPGAIAVLKPRQLAEINTNDIKVVNLTQPYAEAAKAWKDGNFDFRNSDIKSMLRAIGRWYDVKIEYKGKIPDRQYEARLSRNTELSEVLKILQYNGIHSRIEGKKIIVCGNKN
jgi:transmembrane sensor